MNKPKLVRSLLLKIIRLILNFFSLDIRVAFDSGLTFFGVNLHKVRYKNPSSSRGFAAMQFVSELNLQNGLDIGCGSGVHTHFLRELGLEMTAIDLGESVYFKAASNEITIIKTDFFKFQPTKQFDLIWASHILEHQRNPGQFIDKCIELCSDNGYIVFTLPLPDRRFLGGHLSLWTPGILIYNMVMAGIDMSQAMIFHGPGEFAVTVKLKKIVLPDNLHYDKGDINKLAMYMPSEFTEGSNMGI